MRNKFSPCPILSAITLVIDRSNSTATFSLPGLLRFQWAKCSTVRHFLRVYLPLLNVDKDILFLLTIRKSEHEVTINNQYTHGDLKLSSVCAHTEEQVCALQFIESSGSSDWLITQHGKEANLSAHIP